MEDAPVKVHEIADTGCIRLLNTRDTGVTPPRPRQL